MACNESTSISNRRRVITSYSIHYTKLYDFELAVSRPEVIMHDVDGVEHEPWEQLTVDFDEDYQGAVMTCLAERRGELA